MTTHIIWDWNGTLLDDVQACVDSINRMLDARGLPCIDTPYYRDIFDFPVKGYYERLGFDLQTEDWDAMANEFHLHYGQYASTSQLRPRTVDTLDKLRDRGVSMSILSASEIKLLERMLEEREIRPYFDHVVGLSDRYAASKLDHGKQLITTLNTPLQNVILVGDTNHDHEVAQSLGIDCLLLAGGHQSEHRLADYETINQLTDLLNHPAVL